MKDFIEFLVNELGIAADSLAIKDGCLEVNPHNLDAYELICIGEACAREGETLTHCVNGLVIICIDGLEGE